MKDPKARTNMLHTREATESESTCHGCSRPFSEVEQKVLYIYIYIICTHVYIYIYIYREREREMFFLEQ